MWQGLLSEAREYAQKALAAREALKDAAGAADALVVLSRIERADNQCAAAATHVRRARGLAGLDGNSELLARAALIDALVCLGDLTAADTEAHPAAAGSSRGSIELMLAQARLRAAQQRAAEVTRLMDQLVDAVSSVRSQLLHLVVRVVALETGARTKSAAELADLRREVATAGTGLLLIRLDRLAAGG